MKTLYTKRLILRDFAPSDRDEFFEYAKNPNVGPNAGWKPHKTPEDTAKTIEMFIDSYQVWAVEEKESGRLIGSVGLHTDKKRELSNSICRMLGYAFGEKYWGKGYAAEACEAVLGYAFTEMGLKFVSVSHFPRNNRSRRVIEKLGFTYEGTLIAASLGWDGSFEDNCCYLMSLEDYRRKYREK